MSFAAFRYRTLLGAFSIAITMTLSSGVQAAAATDGFYANSQATKGHISSSITIAPNTTGLI